MKQFLLKDPNGPSLDPDPASKKMKLIVKEGPGSTNAVVGDPTVAGAVLWVHTTPGISQCFELPHSSTEMAPQAIYRQVNFFPRFTHSPPLNA